MPISPENMRTIELLEQKLAEQISLTQKWKVAINAIYEVSGEPPPYEVTDAAAAHAAKAKRYAPHQFYGKPLASVVREILSDHGGLTEDEIYRHMLEGGFKFQDGDELRSKHGLKISLGKNSAFDKTSSGVYVLTRVARSGRSPTSRDSELRGDADSTPFESGTEDGGPTEAGK
jgi:hypothetical protein